MILIFKYVPSESDALDQWVCQGSAPDDADLKNLPDGQYAVLQGSEATVKAPGEVLEELPESFTFDSIGTSGSKVENTFRRKRKR